MPESNSLKHICLHAHFYQPPRENPWTGEVERHPSAYPFSNWNERIAEESYIPNSRVPILDQKGDIAEYINNYEYISFNFGPTLFSWIEKERPKLHERIVEADRGGRRRFSGHGGAIAQPYNHIIMPLANRRDKRTQVIWGIKDFEYRFGRSPEGMWLPETAVDIESLGIMAEEGILFTILAPRQAKRIRRIGDTIWSGVGDEGDVSGRPYMVSLPSGKKISIFFYDGPLSHGVAFGGTLNNGDSLAESLIQNLHLENQTPEILSLATDGETYGHHHKFGDKALAYAIRHIRDDKRCHITVYGDYLAKYPPEYEVEIVENSSWSCEHGVERWRGDCGCNMGRDGRWDQGWRKPLRETLDWLRDRLIEVYEKKVSLYMSDPWEGRDNYISVLLRGDAGFSDNQIFIHLSEADRANMIKCLEMERYAMFMYTSCGWFFDDISRVETIQIIRYAAKAVSLAAELGGGALEDEFLGRLRGIRGNRPEVPNGEVLYNIYVKPLIDNRGDASFKYFD